MSAVFVLNAPLRRLSPYGKHLGHGVLHRVHRNLTSAGYSASSVEKYHYHSDCHRRSGGKPDFRSGVLAHTPKRRSHGVPIFGLSSEIMSQVPVYSIFKDHEVASDRSQERTPSLTLNKGCLLWGCFSKKLKNFFEACKNKENRLLRKGSTRFIIYSDLYHFYFFLFAMVSFSNISSMPAVYFPTVYSAFFNSIRALIISILSCPVR